MSLIFVSIIILLVLEEQNEELHAMVLNKGVEEGRHLLNGTSNSLAFELGEMNNREVMKFPIFFQRFIERGRTRDSTLTKKGENTRAAGTFFGFVIEIKILENIFV